MDLHGSPWYQAMEQSGPPPSSDGRLSPKVKDDDGRFDTARKQNTEAAFEERLKKMNSPRSRSSSKDASTARAAATGLKPLGSIKDAVKSKATTTDNPSGSSKPQRDTPQRDKTEQVQTTEGWQENDEPPQSRHLHTYHSKAQVHGLRSYHAKSQHDHDEDNRWEVAPLIDQHRVQHNERHADLVALLRLVAERKRRERTSQLSKSHEMQGAHVWKEIQKLDKALRISSADDGAMEADDRVYMKRMDQAGALQSRFEKLLRKEGITACLIQQDVYKASPFGLKMNQESLVEDYPDIAELKPVAEEHGAMPQKIFSGMFLCAVGAFNCDNKSVKQVSEAIENAPRPVTLTCALPELRNKVGDTDQLQIQSVVNVLQRQVREQGKSACATLPRCMRMPCN
jgi:hypothetical protein